MRPKTDRCRHASTAIANTLVTAWATGKLFNQHPASSTNASSKM